MKPPRRPWGEFPDVLIHADESRVKQYPAYPAAKSGDAGAALELVRDAFNPELPERLRILVGASRPVLVSAHTYEREGVNAIPEVLANLRGHIESHGGRVLAAVALTGKPHSAKLRLTPERLNELRSKHGAELERWWQERFGHAFDALTESEVRYLVRTPDIATIRDRIAAAEQAGNRPQGGGEQMSS